MRGRGNRGGIRLGEVILGGAIVACLLLAIGYQSHRLRDVKQVWARFEQRFRLPPADLIQMAALGYDSVYADWLWLQSIQAFGRGWITENQSTEPIYQYFDTVSDLDPQFVGVYRFGNLVVGDNRRDWVLGQELLRKGSYKNPHNYDLPHLGLYNAIWQYDGKADARWFARRLKRIPEAPAFMKRMEAFIEQKDGRFGIAYEYNIRHYIEYIAADSDIERGVIQGRFPTLLDAWYRREMEFAIQRFIERTGNHPMRMEDILDPAIRPDFMGPTVEGIKSAIEQFADDIDRLDKSKPVPEELVQRVVAATQSRIVGLPPEPFGTWYMIHANLRELYIKEGFKIDQEYRFPYLVSVRDIFDSVNPPMMAAQTFIMDYHKKHGTLPDDAQMAPYNLRDIMGGHYVYQREAPESPIYGVFYSTAVRRISEGKDPRLGAQGPGPFPFPLEPTLKDYPEDYEWGIKNGYILADGTELYDPPGTEPAMPDAPTTILDTLRPLLNP